MAGRTASHDDLKNVDWILREKGSGTRDVFDRALASAGLPRRVAFELEQPEAIRQCVRNGLGMGCMSMLELRDAFQAGWLAPVGAPFLNLERQFQVVLHCKPASQSRIAGDSCAVRGRRRVTRIVRIARASPQWHHSGT